jgi:heme exporter protein A
VLEVQYLQCRRDNRTLFGNITFNLNPGSWVQVTGSNGSGKSSLLRAIVGLLSFVSGQILWKGKSILSSASEYASDCVYVGHKIAVEDRLTPLENLKWWLKLRMAGKEYREAGHSEAPLRRTVIGDIELNTIQARGARDNIVILQQALKIWDLARFANIPCEQLSAGQRQRVALARLVLDSMPLWVLDEPATSLDSTSLTLFGAVVQNHLQAGGMAIIASHIPFRGISLPAYNIDLGKGIC